MRTLHSAQEVAHWLRSRVTGELRTDSRTVQPGDGFIAWPGAATDGRQYLAQALKQGAAACLLEEEGHAHWVQTLSTTLTNVDRLAVMKDLKAQTGFAAHLTDEILGVPRAAAGFGRYQTHPADVVLFDLLLANPQRLNRPPHRRTRQPARGFKPDAKLDSLGKTVHDLKLAALRLGNQHPATVRTKVERGIKRARPRRMGD